MAEEEKKSVAPFLGAGEAGFRLDTLNKAWNTLRNNVLGRGTVPPADVPKRLADEVGRQWVEWRKWYEDATKSFSDAAALFHWGSEFSRHLDAWTQEYSRLRAKALSILGDRRVTVPALVPVSKLDLSIKLKDMAMWGGIGGFTLAMFWIWLRRPVRERPGKSSANA
ncbi:MAG: hypothetical protein ACE5F6_00390 [Anaerolineae bacterium]